MIIKRYSSVLLILFILLMYVSSTSYGNAAEPPSVLIIVPNAPDDLEISIGTGETYTKAKEIDKLIEKYYIFYSREIKKASNQMISVKTNTDSFEIKLDKSPHTYQNIYTLNLKSRTLTPGKSLSRSIMLVALRIAITLVIEGIVFYFFGFRDKRSWRVFLILNLITQGALNIWINGLFPMQGYLIIGLIALELLILLVESGVILSSIKEHKKGRKFLFVLCANFFSLVIGGYVLTVLPF